MTSRPDTRNRHISLDNPAFRGRLRQAGMPTHTSRQPVTHRARPVAGRYDNDLLRQHRNPRSPTAAEPVLFVELVTPEPYVQPARPRQQRSQVLRRSHATQPVPLEQVPVVKTRLRRPKVQVVLVALAVFVFSLGVFVSLQTLQTNHTATARVSALAASQASNNASPVPSTQKPSAEAVANYTVAPDLPRYIDIPALKVHARIMSLGVLSSGALAAPDNVFDAGWYTKSALPGQAGAMLLDGHVSSWTTNGVFYGLKNLKEGDQIQITRGDNTKFTYKVITSQTFSDTGVDMQAALSPITAGKPGLNLITCTGKVKPGTSEFNQRIVVYTEQI